jgi:hypothetical protein
LKLNDLLPLKTCSVYANPGDHGAFIPVVCGDFLSPGVNSSDPAAGGAIPAVLIDVPTWTYALNSGRSALDAPDIYVEDVKQNPSVYTYNATDDFQGQGIITTLTFNTDPAGRQISWRGKGLVDGTGTLITNPISALEQVFTTSGNWLSSDFDPFTIPHARRRCEGYGYTMHWVFNESRTYREWLTDIMPHYFGDLLETDQGKLALVLDEVTSVDPSRIVAYLNAMTDVDDETPENAVEWDLDFRNLCNVLTLRYQYSWSRAEFLASQTFRHERSIRYYGETPVKEMLLPGIRTLQHATQWSGLFFARYALLPAMVRFPLKTTRYLSAMPSNYVTLTWRWGPEATGMGWQDRLLKVLNTTFDVENHRTELECFDTGLDFRPASYAVLQDVEATSWYLSVSDEGLFQLALTNPGQARVNNSTWSWIRLVSPLGVTWYVRPVFTGVAIGSFIIGTHHIGEFSVGWSLEASQPSGTGTTEPVILTSRSGQTWRLVISDAPVRVFFQVEPRRLPFGGQTYQTEVIGRFLIGVNVLS